MIIGLNWRSKTTGIDVNQCGPLSLVILKKGQTLILPIPPLFPFASHDLVLRRVYLFFFLISWLPPSQSLHLHGLGGSLTTGHTLHGGLVWSAVSRSPGELSIGKLANTLIKAPRALSRFGKLCRAAGRVASDSSLDHKSDG